VAGELVEVGVPLKQLASVKLAIPRYDDAEPRSDRRLQKKAIFEAARNCIHMSKSIRLSDEAYERLAAHKESDETFSEVVRRLASERSLLDLAGILDDGEADAVRKAVAERRERRSDDRSIGERVACCSTPRS